MATITEVKHRNLLTVTEALDEAPAASAGVSSNQFDAGTVRLTPTSDPPATKASQVQLDIGAGASSGDDEGETELDLLALDGIQGEFSAVGLRLRLLRVTNSADNGDLTVEPGASDGYDLFGGDNAVTVPAGGRLTMEFGSGAPVVAAAARYLLFSGTEGDTVDVELVFG